MQFENLFSPIKIGTKTARNRLVFPAHGAMLGFYMDGNPGEEYIAYQIARAKGGSGMNVLMSPDVHRTSVRQGWPFNIPTPKLLIPKLKRMADALHEYGTLVLMQETNYGAQYASPAGSALWGFTETAALQERQEVI